MRKLEVYIKKYGPEAGPAFYRALQSQAAHASVSARLRRKIERLAEAPPTPAPAETQPALPLFPEPSAATMVESVPVA